MCKCCKELNEETQDIRIDEIYINHAGHYGYTPPILYCPVCGTILDKYKNGIPDHIKREYDNWLDE